MLLLGAKTFTIDGVTVFADHADQNQFWYLPGPVSIAKRDDGSPDFTFIRYKPAVVSAGAKGGGFVMFDVNLKLRPETESKIRSKCSEFSNGSVTLTAAPFDTGTVRCVALNLQGSGGTAAHAAPDGAFNAVEEILGASIPSMSGDEDAVFSLTLSQEGATILQQAYAQGAAPIGVIYEMKFTALRPALHVKITADFSRIYDHFGASLEGSYYFLKVGIDAAFEKLVQIGAIKVEVIDFTGEADKNDKEKWALDFFKDKLLNDWFEPTLSPGKVAGLDPSGTPAKPADGTGTPKTNGSGTPDKSTNGSGTPDKSTNGSGTPDKSTGGSGTPDKSAGGSGNKPATSGQAATPSTGGGGSATATAVKPADAPAAAPVRQAATFAIDRRSPDPTPAGHGISFQPSAQGTRETLVVSGANASVTIAGVAEFPDASGNVLVDVQPGADLEVQVTWPGTAAVTETFDLFFEYQNPTDEWGANAQNSVQYQHYVNNDPRPDSRFSGSQAPHPGASSGADALRDWLQTLADPKQVTVDAHASWEAHPEKSDYNVRLSERRRDVATGIIGTTAQVTHASGNGCFEAQSVDRRSDPNDRVARITGTVSAAAAAMSVHGRLRRAQSTPQPNGNQPNPNPNPQQPAPQPQGDKPATPGDKPATPADKPKTPEIAGSPEVALKLRYVHQEEKKTLTFEYNRQEAVQRTYAPQGFFDAMLEDLADDAKHFIEVDLDDPFFRTFVVAIDAPIAFETIGLVSSHVSIDYGPPGSAATAKHGDFIFDRANRNAQKFQVYVDKGYDTTYRYAVEYHFDPNSGWDANAFSYALPAKVTEDRTLSVNPYEQLGFLTVSLFPGRLDPVLIASTDVVLSIPDGAAAPIQRTFSVAPGSAEQTWKVRLTDPAQREYTYQLVHHLKDRSTRSVAPVSTKATSLPIDDPFTNAIEIDFLPLFDATQTKYVFIDVQYRDPKNAYARDERLQLAGNAQAPVHLRIALLDPAQTSYAYRLTFVGNDNSMRETAYVTTTETLIPVR